MVHELRSRKLNNSGDKPLKSVENETLTRRKPHENQGNNLYHRLLDLDERATAKCGICATPNSDHYKLRPFFKFFELSGHGVPWIAVPLALMYYTDDRWLLELLLNLLAGIFLDLLVSFVLKTLVRRPRPPVNHSGDLYLTFSIDRLYSFPSGHCTRAGMLALFFIMNLNLSIIQVAVFLLWILGIALSRLSLGRHYVSDVISGVVIGLCQGVFIQYYWISDDYLDHIQDYFK